MRRVAFLGSTRISTTQHALRQVEDAAAPFGISVQALLIGDLVELEAAFAAASAAGTAAAIVQPVLVSRRTVIGAQAQLHGLPWIGDSAEFAESGTLLTYGANRSLVLRRAAGLDDRILRGSAPGDLPVEPPTALELVINIAAARTLGITTPAALLARADRAIE